MKSDQVKTGVDVLCDIIEYHGLGNNLNGVNAFQAFLRLTRNNPYTLQELCTAFGDD